MRKLFSALTALSLLIAFSSCAASIDEIDTNSSSNINIESNIEEEAVILDAFENVEPTFTYGDYPYQKMNYKLDTKNSEFNNRLSYSSKIISADTKKIIIEVKADIEKFNFYNLPKNSKFETDTKIYEISLDDISSCIINKEQLDKCLDTIVNIDVATLDSTSSVGGKIISCYFILPKEETIFYENLELNSSIPYSDMAVFELDDRYPVKPNCYYIAERTFNSEPEYRVYSAVFAQSEGVFRGSYGSKDWSYGRIAILKTEEEAKKYIEDEIKEFESKCKYDFDVIDLPIK